MKFLLRHQAAKDRLPYGLKSLGLVTLGLVALEACSSSESRPRYQGAATQAQAEGGAAEETATGESEVSASGGEGASGGTSTPQPPPTPAAPAAGSVPAKGSVTISLNILPPTPAGPYRNRGHVRAAWVSDSSDIYLKTLHAFAGQRALHLKRWFAFTGSTIDGASGPTQTTPASIPISASWDLKSKAGIPMYTGTYKLWLEYTEANTPQLDATKKPIDGMQPIDGVNGYEYLVVPFAIGTEASTKSELSNAVFKEIVIRHTP